jgi:death-on-curing protein
VIALTAQQLLFLHARLAAETGGSAALREVGLLRSAWARPMVDLDRYALFPDPFLKAAALLVSLIDSRPFIDGNRRLGFAAAVIFLQLNGISVRTSPEEAVRVAHVVEKGEMTVAAVADWLNENRSRAF